MMWLYSRKDRRNLLEEIVDRLGQHGHLHLILRQLAVIAAPPCVYLRCGVKWSGVGGDAKITVSLPG